jgi:hypothetical protein
MQMRSVWVSVVLILLAVAILVRPDLVFRLSGFSPLAELKASSLDKVTAPDDTEAPVFLAQRNEVDLVVPRDMTVKELLSLYHMAELSHIRRQIAKQEGAQALPDSYLLHQGKRYKITLTPPEEGAP